jgi:hypothetical protein
MGKSLIIRQGERTTRLLVREGPILIGRDPKCDLFFDDSTLSRSHARLEVASDGVRLVDLNSSNGSWVNEERVAEHVVGPADVIRLGQILLTVEEASARQFGSSEHVQDEDSWLFLPLGQSPASGDDIVSGTEDTLPFLPPLSEGALQPSPSPPPSLTPSAPRPAVHQERTEPGLFQNAAERVAAWSWATKIGLSLTSLGLLAYVAVAGPLVKTLRSVATEDFLRRGHALVRYLAAENEHLLAEGKLQDLSVEALSREPGVKEAFILDLNGKVLAPSVQGGESFETIEGIGKKTREIYTFYLGRNQAGDYHFVLPLTDKGRRIGIALLTCSVPDPVYRGAVLTLLSLSFLFIAACTYGVARYAKSTTLKPLGALVEDVEAVVKGDECSVPAAHAYRELEELAASVNRLIERATPPRSVAVVARATPDAAVVSTKQPSADVPLPQRVDPPIEDSPPDILPPLSPHVSPPLPVNEEDYEVVLPLSTSAVPLPERRLAPPSLRPDRTPSPSPTGAGDGELIVDENYIVTGADKAALSLLGAEESDVQGKHLLEAVRELSLLEQILDLLNALSDGGPTFRQFVTSSAEPLSLSVRRRGTNTIVRLTPERFDRHGI